MGRLIGDQFGAYPLTSAGSDMEDRNAPFNGIQSQQTPLHSGFPPSRFVSGPISCANYADMANMDSPTTVASSNTTTLAPQTRADYAAHTLSSHPSPTYEQAWQTVPPPALAPTGAPPTMHLPYVFGSMPGIGPSPPPGFAIYQQAQNPSDHATQSIHNPFSMSASGIPVSSQGMDTSEAKALQLYQNQTQYCMYYGLPPPGQSFPQNQQHSTVLPFRGHPGNGSNHPPPSVIPPQRKTPPTSTDDDEGDGRRKPKRKQLKLQDMTEDEMKQEQLLRNREAAAKCREKKKRRDQHLMELKKVYGEHNAALKIQAGDLISQVLWLRDELASAEGHGGLCAASARVREKIQNTLVSDEGERQFKYLISNHTETEQIRALKSKLIIGNERQQKLEKEAAKLAEAAEAAAAASTSTEEALSTEESQK